MGYKNIHRLYNAGLKAGEAADLGSSDVLAIKPVADDTGAVNVGDGTTDMDVKVFLGATTDYIECNVGDGQVNIESAELHLGDSDEIEFGDGNDVVMQWDGTDFDVTLAADESTINFGNGTNDPIVKIFGGAASAYAQFSSNTGQMSFAGAAYPVVKVSTLTANTTLNSTHFGGIVTSNGSIGADLVVTLPAAAAGNKGAWFQWVTSEGYNTTLTATANTMIVLNDATATSLAFSTANELIGASALFVSTGAKWIGTPLVGTATYVS